MYTLPPSMKQRFNLYLNILPVVEQAAMYLLFVTGTIFILSTVYSLTFKVMFKKEKHFDNWKGKEIYNNCEISLRDTDPECNMKPNVLRIQSERLKDLSSKLSDKVYDTVGSVKDKVMEEINHVKYVFERRGSKNVGHDIHGHEYRNDTEYTAIKQSDSEDECKYLEILDDGSDLVATKYETERSEKLKDLDSNNIR